MGKKKAASTPADFPCANAGCLVTGRDKVNKWFAGCGAWYALPEAALGRARRQPQGPLQTGAAEARGGPADFPCANTGCPVTGQDTVNQRMLQRCAGCGAMRVLLPPVPEASLGRARRQPQEPL